MKLTSPAFNHNETVPQKYTCEGEDISPPLQVEDVPQGTQSLVLIIEDPDAVSGTWDHWLVVNIDPTITEIPEGEVPDGGEQIKNSFGKKDYGGPCPPDEPVHRYFFKLCALNTTLDASVLNSKTDIQEAMNGNVLNAVELIGRYQKT